MLALSFVMNLSGQTVSLGFALAAGESFWHSTHPRSRQTLFDHFQVIAAEQTGPPPGSITQNPPRFANSSAGAEPYSQ